MPSAAILDFKQPLPFLQWSIAASDKNVDNVKVITIQEASFQDPGFKKYVAISSLFDQTVRN